jgi:SAM-dependent methyltransferase
MNEDIKRHYQKLLLLHGDAAESAQYSSRDSQFRRFAALARIGNMRGKRILDYGCGTACLHEYLCTINQEPASYHGADIVEDFFDLARSKVPNGFFSLPDQIGSGNYDYAFVSGVFNNIRPDNRSFWQQTVTSLFSKCRHGLAFNLMSTYVDYQDSSLFYEDPCLAFDFVKRNITPFVSINHDYLAKKGSIPFEYTIFAYREPVGTG